MREIPPKVFVGLFCLRFGARENMETKRNGRTKSQFGLVDEKTDLHWKGAT